ncbi:hypothetical protein Tco_0356489 [Tanacetum coccineum]
MGRKLEEIIRDRRKKKEDMSIEEMMHEQQLVDREMKEIINDLGYKRFRGEEIDEEYGVILKHFTPQLIDQGVENSSLMVDEPLSTIPANRIDDFAVYSAHIAPIPPGIVEADSDDDTLSDDDDFEDVERYSSREIIKHQCLISKIESLKDNPTPDRVFESPSPFPIPVADSDSFLEESDTSLSHLDNSLPEFETFSDHYRRIEPDQEGLISIDNSNDPLLELPEFESFHFDPSFPRPPPEPPNVCLDLLSNDVIL